LNQAAFSKPSQPQPFQPSLQCEDRGLRMQRLATSATSVAALLLIAQAAQAVAQEIPLITNPGLQQQLDIQQQQQQQAPNVERGEQQPLIQQVQVSSSLLPAPEDFSDGGPFLGRAFRGPYLVGDQGDAADLELSQAFDKDS
jgi:hypothetical protein